MRNPDHFAASSKLLSLQTAKKPINLQVILLLLSCVCLSLGGWQVNMRYKESAKGLSFSVKTEQEVFLISKSY